LLNTQKQGLKLWWVSKSWRWEWRDHKAKNLKVWRYSSSRMIRKRNTCFEQSSTWSLNNWLSL